MKKICGTAIFIVILLIQSCSTQNSEVFWVGGVKTDCDAGAGKLECLNIYRGGNLEAATWENFYAGIEGFAFEEGFLKKVKVKKETLKKVPADASSIKYTLVKELDKKADIRILLNGKWMLSRLNNAPVNRSIKLPEMTIELSKRKISGTSSCNNYMGTINNVTSTSILFGNIVSTRKACIHKNIEPEYLAALNAIKTFKVAESMLVFYDENGKELLFFFKSNEASVTE